MLLRSAEPEAIDYRREHERVPESAPKPRPFPPKIPAGALKAQAQRTA